MRLLNLVVVLLLRNISLTKAEPVTATTDLRECSSATIQNCNSAEAASKYCYKDNKIFTLDEDGACTTAAAITLTAGVKIFDFTTKAEAVTTGALENLATIVLFNCVENGTVTCKRTYGYVKTDTNYYSIGADGKNEEVVAGPADTRAGVLDPATFKLNVGDGVEFVSDGNGSIYLVELLDNGIFLSTEDYKKAILSETHFILEAVSNTFIFSKFNSGGEFCVLKSKVVTNLDSEKQNIFCDSFDNIYNCFNDSLCRFYKSFDKPGKYIEDDGSFYVLYVCEGNPIVCTKDDGTNDGVHIFKKYSNEKYITFIKLTEDLASIDIEKEDYNMFDCKSGFCERTSGFIKYGIGFSKTGECSEDFYYCTERDWESSIEGNAGKLNISGTGFTYTIKHGLFEYDAPKPVTGGKDYFFAYGTYKYDYITFSNAHLVAFVKNVNEFDDIYITTSTNVVGKGAEKCNSNTYYHYVIRNNYIRFDSGPCNNQIDSSALPDNTETNNGNCCTSTKAESTYCYKDNKIYTLDEDGACTTAEPITISSKEGVKIFDFTRKVEVTTGALENLETIVLFNCFEGDKCKRTYDYVKTDNNRYYRIGADGINEEVVSGDADTTSGVLNPATFKLNVLGTIGPRNGVIDPDTYKLNIENGAEFVSDDSGSSYFVELANNGIFLSSKDYEIANTPSKTIISIMAVKNTFIFNNVLSFDLELFGLHLTSSSLVFYVFNGVDTFTGNDIFGSFDSLYSCSTDGICKLSVTFAGKYIKDHISYDNGHEIRLYVCDGNPVVCTKDDGTNDGVNVFKLINDGKGTLVKLVEDLASVDLESEKYQLFDCKSADCRRTSGYIKYGKDFSSVGRCPYDADCTVQAEADNTGLEGLYRIQSTLKYTGTGFTYTIQDSTPKDLISGNDYLFVEDKYSDYICFSKTNIVAFYIEDIRKKEYDVYINTSTNVVGKGAEKCNSDIYYHYVISFSYIRDSALCENTDTIPGNSTENENENKKENDNENKNEEENENENENEQKNKEENTEIENNAIGYIISDENNISICKQSPKDIICTEYTITETSCTSDNIGKLFKNNEKNSNEEISICLNYSDKEYSVKLNAVNQGNYVLYKSSTTNEIFGTSNDKPYVIITINKNSVLLNTKYSNGLKYVYINKEGNTSSSMYRIMNKGDNCQKNIENILELECNNGLCSEHLNIEN
ncbi:hypothetical protein H8356DRAFT_1351700 [Neocallimastix lanati (nom. inval.)]|nr:hypothetical protein H8356DRAFT_1351700 [Neocallimastix sp. JGI-2020a]